MDCSTPGFSVLYSLLEFAQIHVHWASDANYLILCHSLLLLPSDQDPFPVSWLFASGGQTTGASASASILPMKIQGLFPSGLTGLISLLSKGLSRVFSSTTIESIRLVDINLFFKFGKEDLLYIWERLKNLHIIAYLPSCKNIHLKTMWKM